jgi:hypothetical protein
MRLNGGLVYSTGTEDETTWRRALHGSVNLTITTTGDQLFQIYFTCGSGTSSFSDGGGEWPNGGVSHTVIVGG